MQDSFNPYVEWLGIAGARGRPNHYALLGVAPLESDVVAIAAAAERRIGAIERITTEAREPLRQQLLAELTQAKRTLIDANQKKRYDELLRQKAAARNTGRTTSSTVERSDSPRTPTTPAQTDAELLPPRAAGMDEPPPPVVSTAADPMAPVLPAGATVGRNSDPLAPFGQPVSSLPAPSWQSSPSGQTPRDELSAADISDQLASARMAARKLAQRRQRAQHWMIAAMLITLVVVAAGLAVGYATGLIRIGSESAVAEREPESFPSGSPTRPGDEDEITAPESSSRDSPVDRGAGELQSQPRGEKTSRTGGSNDTAPATVPTGSHDSTKPPAVDARDKSGTIKGRDSAQPTNTPLDSTQTAQFMAELAAARSALGERKYEEANKRIDAAERLAQSVEQEQLVAGFQMLPKFVQGFWEAVAEGLQGLEEAGELKMSNTIVSIVEVGTEQLVIRVEGQNRRYPVDQLPAGLAVAIAKKWFDERPDNKVYLGAFYFVDPRTDVAEAKRLWEEAAGEGIDVKSMLALLPIATRKAAAERSR